MLTQVGRQLLEYSEDLQKLINIKNTMIDKYVTDKSLSMIKFTSNV